VIVEAALARQRAVNEALMAVLPHIHRNPCFWEEVGAATFGLGTFLFPITV
jgi:hypothetical protein